MCLNVNARAASRVVILAPAVADVLARLEAGSTVVGVTNTVKEFPQATRLGTHLNPGVEKIASLKPDLIIATGRFNPELAERMGAELFLYDPRTLEEIIEDIRILAGKIGRAKQGEKLAAELQSMLDGLRVPEHQPTALYESRSNPLSVAKKNSIIKNLLERAGFVYLYPESAGPTSAEYLLAHQPEFYLYQEGPMNRNPVPPHERPGWARLDSCIWKVDELEFTRANTQIFETLKTLNGILNAEDACTAGRMVYSE